ncbi:Alpha/Beta hydrolase protein [Ephemerocybe angulata]|uniref:Carboxylic ester hydrolase n=1 Tax=Ephemerocybe angulata TaxID=980116 RepID=A0A8H6M8K4_9AGAR|nr:Alpha/Beta hydrolase protein [Tulosesus angulatus]
MTRFLNRRSIPLFLLPIALRVIGTSAAGPPIVDLGYATYQGVPNTETGNTEFLGIRYAAPPTGKARWREPRLPAKAEGIQMADTQPQRCQQAPEKVDKRNRSDLESYMDTGSPESDVEVYGEGGQEVLGEVDKGGKMVMTPVSEDCLFLNVVTPGTDFSKTSNSARKLPVVVWIHGGGYALGSASKPGLSSMRIYDGNDLVRDSGGKVIAVLIQYRLGLFGFLAGSDVKKNGVLNAGLRDQQFALQWVQSHISKFGGDPEKVTIWGQSAGGGSVLQHLIANGGKTHPPLFRAAMLSSAFLPSQYWYNDHIPETLYERVIREAGCENAQDRLECLRDTDLSALHDVNARVAEQALYGTFAFIPVVDGEFIRTSPLAALKKGKLNSRHVLAVVNTFEGRMFIDPESRDSVDVADYLSRLFPLFRGNQIHLAMKNYENMGTPFETVIQIMGDAIFACPTYWVLQGLKGRGYKAEFAVPPGDHIDDVLYFFPTITPAGVPPFNNPAFTSTFSGAFMDFVRHRDPNIKSPGSILPHWPKWDRWYTKEMIFNRTGDAPDIKTSSTPKGILERCEFWESAARWTGQ